MFVKNQTKSLKIRVLGIILLILGIVLVPQLLSAQSVDALKINFQPATVAVPSGYVADVGALYGAQGNYTYGWNINHTDLVRVRGVNVSPVLDTLVHMHEGGSWELALTNGNYQVTVGIGDASFTSTHTINVEGVSYWNAVALSAGQFLNKSQIVSVVDGRLTLNNGVSSEKQTRLNFIEIVKVGATATPVVTSTPSSFPTAQVKVNFQPKAVEIPAGYLPDYGEVKGARNGYTYGWSVYSGDVVRDRSINPNQLLDTIAHFHAGAKWELAVANGDYDVKVSVGDAGYASTHTIRVEGVSYWNNVTTSPNQFLNLTKTVKVSDGNVTIDCGSSGEKQTRINFVEVVPKWTTVTPTPPPTPTPTPTLTSLPLSTLSPLTGNLGCHDPVLAQEGNTWWVFYTGIGLRVKYSTDRLYWREGTQIFSSALAWWKNYAPAMGANDAWAPDIGYYNGRWWLFYSVSEFGRNNSAIGLVSAPTIQSGSWRDDGMVISSNSSSVYNAIDPNLVIDTANNPWLVFGSWFDGIKITRLDKYTMKPTGSLYTLARRADGLEGASLTYRNGYYYLFASIDKCCSGILSDYKMSYGRSTNITGPFKDKNGIDMLNGGGTVLDAGNARWKGPGGQSLYNNSVLVYHAYDASDNGYPKLMLRNLYWDASNWPTYGDGNLNGFYKLQNRRSGKYLEVGAALLGDGAAVIQWENTNHACQEWQLAAISDGYYRLQNRNSRKYFEVGSAAVTNGATTNQWMNTNHACQEWQLVKVGDYYKLINRNSGKVAEAANASLDNGAAIVQGADINGEHQLWKLIWVTY
jgi:arabinan endo-1,5-alpha-L-arabinosidase